MESHSISITAFARTAILLKGEKTVHTTFKFPLDIEEKTTCCVKPNLKEAEN